MQESGGSFRERLQRLEVDRSVFYAISSRGWQFLAGPLTVWLIAKFFSADMQGFFYTFGSVLAMQLFFELGLATVLVNLVSHEWASLSLTDEGTVEGDAEAGSRLAAITSTTGRWYWICAALFVVGTGPAGVWLFSEKENGIDWQAPWWAVVVISALAMQYIPKMATLEACGQVRTVNQNRLFQAVSGSVVVWLAICLDFGLWTCVASAAVRLFWEFVLVEVRFGTMFRSLKQFRPAPESFSISGRGDEFAGENASRDEASVLRRADFDWWTEAWPLQWRIAVQSVALWFANYAFTPVIWKYHSEAAAGRMGMTMQIVTAIQAAAIAWLQTRVPTLGTLAAKRDFTQFDRLFRRIAVNTTVLTAVGGVGLLGVLSLLNHYGHPLADRLLPVLPTALLLLGVSVHHVVICQGVYVRAQKQDPFLKLATTVYLLIGAAVWFFGQHYGALGVAAAWLAITALIHLPLNTVVWRRHRRDRSSLDESSSD
jgi:hypothetical protein